MLEKDAEGASIEFRLCAGRWVAALGREPLHPGARCKEGRLVEVEGIVIDITERKAAEEKIACSRAPTDSPALRTASTFIERLRQAFAAAKRGRMPFAVLYLDLDKFKPVNDTLGHPAGTCCCGRWPSACKSCTRESDLIARLGGDEFAVLQTEMGEPADCRRAGGEDPGASSAFPILKGNEINISVSIGICPYVAGIAGPGRDAGAGGSRPLSLQGGGPQPVSFPLAGSRSGGARAGHARRRVAARDRRHELELQYQPQVELASGKIIGMEALVRWNHPTRGLLAPGPSSRSPRRPA